MENARVRSSWRQYKQGLLSGNTNLQTTRFALRLKTELLRKKGKKKAKSLYVLSIKKRASDDARFFTFLSRGDGASDQLSLLPYFGFLSSRITDLIGCGLF